MNELISLVACGGSIFVFVMVIAWFALRNFKRPVNVTPNQNAFLHLMIFGFGGVGFFIAIALVGLIVGDGELTRTHGIMGLGVIMGSLWIGREVRKRILKNIVERVEGHQTQE